ncbi:MAG: hypothetical protein IKL18_07805 [Oscillospiraceae bacterium]|nr:hypothetical protein [Oscillospiraceae bacterium]MBR3609949.1 hypothetical protein [Oscillospiraceae bacterium]MBR6658053.1 hypothetical protein [Oscillospiraceae bacterium]
MRKAAICIAIVSIIVFIIAWGTGGIMIYENDYESNAWLYVGLISMVIFFGCLIYLKTTRCTHCGRINPTFGEFCPYCGKKIK